MVHWFSIIVSPLVFLANLSLAYALVPLACQTQRTAPLQMSNAVALAIVVAALLLAWREQRATASSGGTLSEAVVRSHFLSKVGAWVSAISAFAIALQWTTQWLIAPCVA